MMLLTAAAGPTHAQTASPKMSVKATSAVYGERPTSHAFQNRRFALMPLRTAPHAPRRAPVSEKIMSATFQFMTHAEILLSIRHAERRTTAARVSRPKSVPTTAAPSATGTPMLSSAKQIRWVVVARRVHLALLTRFPAIHSNRPVIGI